MKWNRETGCPTWGFSLVVCRHPDGRFLAVQETRGRGWWLPGGFVEPGDDYLSTAIKETQEEAGLQVQIKGLLRIECVMNAIGARQRMIFYAEPVDPNQPPKTIADEESLSAAWLSLADLRKKSLAFPPMGLRGPELLQWGEYLENGGPIYPLGLYSLSESDKPQIPQQHINYIPPKNTNEIPNTNIQTQS
jgi:8-oxo-dGTP pyrophosphatase MutT (NUDIX family)